MVQKFGKPPIQYFGFHSLLPSANVMNYLTSSGLWKKTEAQQSATKPFDSFNLSEPFSKKGELP
jgi:hypothetical protein